MVFEKINFSQGQRAFFVFRKCYFLQELCVLVDVHVQIILKIFKYLSGRCTWYSGETMPRKSAPGKTVQNPLVVDVPPDDLAHVELPRKKGAGKKDLEAQQPLTPTETSLVPDGQVTIEILGRFPAASDFPFSAPIPIAIRPRFEEIGEIMRNVCRDHINDEYYHLGILLLEKLARKRPIPLLAGKTDAWAAGILTALGKINFLFDKSSLPYITREDLAGYCGVKQSTSSGKSKQIRDMFDMSYWDPRFSTQRMHDGNPYPKFYSILAQFR